MPVRVVISMWVQGLVYGGLIVAAVTAMRCSVPEKQDPVCGSDNRTYSNRQEIECMNSRNPGHRVMVEHDGPCEGTCPYSLELKPVCGSDGYTYGNMEALECMKKYGPERRLSARNEGHCRGDAEYDACKASRSPWTAFHPVCASNGITYRDFLAVKCLKKMDPEIRITHGGPCTADDVTSTGDPQHACVIAALIPMWAPVCASDRQTYNNPYTLACMAKNKQGLSMTKLGPCEAEPVDVNPCQSARSARRATMCGSDGVTYPNLESLLCAASKDTALHMVHEGPCTDVDDPCRIFGFPTTQRVLPVCSEEGKTYINPSALWCAARNDPEIKMAYSGECI